MPDPAGPAPPVRVRWGVYVVEGQRLRRPMLVRPAEELVLLAVVTPPTPLTVELYRGDRLRDRQEWTPPHGDGEAVLAVRLGRSATLRGSARLRCRLLIDGREVGQRTVLLGAPVFDAQGRLAELPADVPSEATRLAYVRLLEEAADPDG
jgi:hypothetical protein